MKTVRKDEQFFRDRFLIGAPHTSARMGHTTDKSEASTGQMYRHGDAVEKAKRVDISDGTLLRLRKPIRAFHLIPIEWKIALITTTQIRI